MLYPTQLRRYCQEHKKVLYNQLQIKCDTYDICMYVNVEVWILEFWCINFMQQIMAALTNNCLLRHNISVASLVFIKKTFSKNFLRWTSCIVLLVLWVSTRVLVNLLFCIEKRQFRLTIHDVKLLFLFVVWSKPHSAKI